MHILRLQQVEWTLASVGGVEISRSPVQLAGALPLIPPSNRRAISRQKQTTLEAALDVAQDIFAHTCPLSDLTRKPRCHSIEFLHAAEAGNTLMSTRTFLAKVEQGGELAWVPTALLRQKVPQSDLEEFNELVPYDLRIFVNENSKFAVSDSSCEFVTATEDGEQFFSATSVLLHELLHGMGILSLGIDASVLGNATHGNLIGTIWDNNIRDVENNLFAPLSQMARDVHVPGKSLFVAGRRLYNPPEWRPGSSLSHFASATGEPGIMGYNVLPGRCQFVMPKHLITALITIGWPCNASTNLPGLTWDSNVYYFNDEETHMAPESYVLAAWMVMLVITTGCCIAILWKYSATQILFKYTGVPKNPLHPQPSHLVQSLNKVPK